MLTATTPDYNYWGLHTAKFVRELPNSFKLYFILFLSTSIIYRKAVIGKSPDGVFVGFLSGGIPPY